MDKNTKNDDFVKEMEDFLKQDDENIGHFHADKFLLSDDFFTCGFLSFLLFVK